MVESKSTIRHRLQQGGAPVTFDNTNATTADTEVRYLKSAIVGDEFKLFVAHPAPGVEPGRNIQ